MPPQRKLIRFAKEKLLRAYVREAAHLEPDSKAYVANHQ